jgi:hypothetical protein
MFGVPARKRVVMLLVQGLQGMVEACFWKLQTILDRSKG